MKLHKPNFLHNLIQEATREDTADFSKIGLFPRDMIVVSYLDHETKSLATLWSEKKEDENVI